MTQGHEQFQALAAAYALGILDQIDRQHVDAHLATCQACADEVRGLSLVPVALATAAEATPPPGARDRVLQRVRHAAVRSSAPLPFAPRPLPPAVGARWAAWVPAAAIAASVVVAIGFGFYARDLRGRVADLEARLDRAQTRVDAAERRLADAQRAGRESQAVVAVLAAPDMARIDLAGQTVAPRARARALWSRARGMVFTVDALPPLPPGKVYQVWVVTGSAPISAGLLVPDARGGAVAVYQTSPEIPAPVAVAVTIEPAGGVPAPTGAKFLVGAV